MFCWTYAAYHTAEKKVSARSVLLKKETPAKVENLIGNYMKIHYKLNEKVHFHTRRGQLRSVWCSVKTWGKFFAQILTRWFFMLEDRMGSVLTISVTPPSRPLILPGVLYYWKSSVLWKFRNLRLPGSPELLTFQSSWFFDNNILKHIRIKFYVENFTHSKNTSSWK